MRLKAILKNLKTFATRDISLSMFDNWLDGVWHGVSSKSGVNVNADTALSIAAVYDCIRVISEDCAKLPLFLYRKTGERSRVKALEHPLYYLLHDSPNPEMTSQEYRETCTGHVLLRGNSYSQIIRDRRGNVAQLIPLNPAHMNPRRNETGALVYRYMMDGGTTREFSADEILHIRGMSPDGIMGYSPIRVFADTLGLSKATSDYAAEFFKNNATPDIAFTHPGALGDTAYKRLKDSLTKQEDRQGSLILEEGMTVHQIGMSHQDSQFIESREFSIEEICQIFRMPPHKIAHMKQATFSNIEHQAIEYVVDTLTPWLARWEQRLNKQLLGPVLMAEGYYFEHSVNGLLRGDIKARFEAYNFGRNGGWLSANDIRELENMNEIDGGDTYLVPANNIPAELVSDFWKAKTVNSPSTPVQA